MSIEAATHEFAKDKDDVDVSDRQKLFPDVEDGLQQRNSLSVSEKRIVLFKSLFESNPTKLGYPEVYFRTS